MKLKIFTFCVIAVFVLSPCSFARSIENQKSTTPTYTYHYIQGFSRETNERIKKFLNNTIDIKDDKIAVFDCDGTLIGQAPHYIADEATFLYATKHPKWNSEVIKELENSRIENNRYDLLLTLYFAGLKVDTVENIGYNFYKKYYSAKYFSPMLRLVKNLQNYNFKIWVITSSPEILYQKIVSTIFNIPENHIIGVSTLVKNGMITKTPIPLITENSGKVVAIDTFIKAKPLFAAGNSSADFEMINDSKGLKLVVNPDDKKTRKLFDGNTLKGYAKKHDWIIAHIKDQPPKGYPNVTTKVFHLSENPAVD